MIKLFSILPGGVWGYFHSWGEPRRKMVLEHFAGLNELSRHAIKVRKRAKIRNQYNQAPHHTTPHIFMPPKELWEAYSNRTIRPSVHPSVRPSHFSVRSISPIFFELGIPNLVCGYILGWQSVAYHFQVTMTLTSDLVFRIIVFGAYLLYYLRQESQIWCVDASWDDEVSRTIIGSL